MSQQEAQRKPISEESIATNGETAVTPWAEAQQRLEEAQEYWLSTTDPDGRPHVMPLFSVWLDDAMYFTSNANARKAKNLAKNSAVAITTTVNGLDLIVEGNATKITDEVTLRRVAEVYASKYEWDVRVRDGAYVADYGAPSAGPPPYELYKIQFTKAFGMNTVEPYSATRWRFED